MQARSQDITASQVAALFHEHEWTTPFDLWAVKTGRAPRLQGETDAIRRGRHLEIVAVNLLREQYPKWKIEHNAAENIYYRDPVARLGATPDVIVKAPGKGRGVVQIKSVEASTFKRKWTDDEGSIDVPLWIAMQAILEAHLTGADWAAVAPLVVGHGLEMPLIEIPTENMAGVVRAMEQRTADFWQMVAEDREPIPDYTRDGPTIAAIYGMGDPEHEVDLTEDNRVPELIADREALGRKIAEARAEIEAIDAEVKAKLGHAHIGHLKGGRKITWIPRSREGFFVEPTTIRALNYPQNRK